MHTLRKAVVGASACALLVTAMPSIQAAEEETAGNNLSVPVLWSEADYLPPITTPVTERFEGQVLPGHVVALDSTSTTCRGAVQKDPDNIWQAPVSFQAGTAVTTVDWGDNLEAMDPNLSRAYTRVEVGLTKALATPSTGYDMCWISGKGMDEMWGAQVAGDSGGYTAITSERSEALVYTAGARLTIQRIVPGRDYSWDSSTARWQGTGADAPYYNGAIHEGAADGPGSLGAEITVSGRMSYGYLWATNAIPQGEYRLTFSLDGPRGAFPGSGASLSSASLAVSEESGSEEEMSVSARGSANVPVMRNDLNLTYIDVGVGTRTDPIPNDDATVPPPSGGTASSGSTTPVVTTPGNVGGPPVDSPAIGVGIPPQAASLPVRQQAMIRAAKSGIYRVGTALTLSARPVYTDTGVTVRWRRQIQDRDHCTIRVRDGRATVRLDNPGVCRVVGWAPAPSPEYAAFRWTRTYRAVG